MSKTRARILILSKVLSFPTVSRHHWLSTLEGPVSGDLVSLNCCDPSKWFLSWVREVEDKGENSFTRYLLESVDDGALCWWSNVGFTIYNREEVAQNSMWRWSDPQFAFYDRWMRVGKRNDAYIVLPCAPVFADDGSATLNVRIRFGLRDFSNPRVFSNWKRTKSGEMDAYFKQCVEAYNSHNTERSGDSSAPVAGSENKK